MTSAFQAQVKALLARLEADPHDPLPDQAMYDMLDDGKRADYLLNLQRCIEQQRADYEAAPKPREPRAVERFGEGRDLHLEAVKSRLGQKKTILKSMAKLQERLDSHNRYLADQWQTLWDQYDALADEEKAWFEPPVTLSDRGQTNFPRHYVQPPVRAVLPDQIPARTAAQMKILSRLLDD